MKTQRTGTDTNSGLHRWNISSQDGPSPLTLPGTLCARPGMQEHRATNLGAWEARPRASGSGLVDLEVSLMVFQLVHLLTWALVGKQVLPSTPTSHRHNCQWSHTQNCRMTCPSQGETPEMTKRKQNSLGCCFSCPPSRFYSKGIKFFKNRNIDLQRLF